MATGGGQSAGSRRALASVPPKGAARRCFTWSAASLHVAGRSQMAALYDDDYYDQVTLPLLLQPPVAVRICFLFLPATPALHTRLALPRLSARQQRGRDTARQRRLARRRPCAAPGLDGTGENLARG